MLLMCPELPSNATFLLISLLFGCSKIAYSFTLVPYLKQNNFEVHLIHIFRKHRKN
jgi:hypothetical protein